MKRLTYSNFLLLCWGAKAVWVKLPNANPHSRFVLPSELCEDSCKASLYVVLLSDVSVDVEKILLCIFAHSLWGVVSYAVLTDVLVEKQHREVNKYHIRIKWSISEDVKFKHEEWRCLHCFLHLLSAFCRNVAECRAAASWYVVCRSTEILNLSPTTEEEIFRKSKHEVINHCIVQLQLKIHHNNNT